MKPVIVINRFVIQHDKMNQFIDAQKSFAARLIVDAQGLSGGRMYRSVDATSAVLISQFESESARQRVVQSQAFKDHVAGLAALVESASPLIYEEAYTTGHFK